MKQVKGPEYFKYLQQLQQEALKNVGKEFNGSSPPEVFVGEYNYPNVFTGILAPATQTQEEIPYSPELWYKNQFSTHDIMMQRGGMVYSRFIQPVKRQTQFTGILQEVSMAKKHTDLAFELFKKPTINLKLDSIHHPVFNPAPLKFVKPEQNISVAKRIDYITNDHHLKAQEGILDLYKHDFDITKINRILSAGLLGIKPQRKLVPTKWSITATDDIISQHLINQIYTYEWINDIEVYQGEYLGNHYEIILMPRQWSFEVLEATWNQDPYAIKFWQDYETHYKRKTYASSVVGGYYAVRIAVAEHLAQRHRQASALVLRQVKDYDIPCGVGILRELTRDVMTKQPEKFTTLNEALAQVQKRLLIPLHLYTKKSNLIKELTTQKTLQQYF